MLQDKAITDAGSELNHWPNERIKNRLRFAYGDSLASENRIDGHVPVFGSNGIVGSHDVAITHGQTIIIGRKGSFGKIGWSNEPCFPIDTTYFIDSTLTSENLRWLYYALQSLNLDTINFDSAVPGLSREATYTLRLQFPPVREQQRIAVFLDASCSALDEAVAAKRQQIEALGALKENVIEAAITFGTKPGLRLRPVNEDWMADVPSHWRVCRIKRIVSRVDYGISQGTEVEGRFPVLKMGHIQERELVFSNLDFIDDVSADLLLEKGDLLFNRTNSHDQVGKAAIFRGDFNTRLTFASYLVRLRTNHRADPYWLNYVVNSQGFLGFARKLAIPSVQQANLNSTRYCRMLIPLPPLPEQKEIASFLDEKTAEIRSTANILGKQISTLLAYRKSLIHECVTGQRRVTEEDLNKVLSNG
jgi:type I restriction enzyme S subunit